MKLRDVLRDIDILESTADMELEIGGISYDIGAMANLDIAAIS